nr:putative metal-dependent hydrolase [Polycladomyces abyssicola]
MNTDLRYPIGQFEKPDTITTTHVQQWIDELDSSAEQLRHAVSGLTPQQWDTPYRPGGWTVRQVVHHVADAQMHNYIRFKRALTEEEPEVYVWEHDGWAEMADSRTESPEVSLQLIEALNRRWVVMLRSLKAADFKRTFFHPVMGRMSLDEALGLFVWHIRHHVAQITHLRQRMGW